jgi:hypothetical protein
MDEFFASGRVADLLLGLMALEAALLGVYRLLAGRGPSLTELLANLGAGACLLLALRALLTGAGWQAAALWLSGALILHLADLATRWRH